MFHKNPISLLGGVALTTYMDGRNPFWDSKPELFSDIACLRIPYQPCIVLFGNFFSGTPASNRRKLRLLLNAVPTGAGLFKSRHILLHKYVDRIMITYLWRQIQLIIPRHRFRCIECRHFVLFWKYVTWSLFSRIALIWYSWPLRFCLLRTIYNMYFNHTKRGVCACKLGPSCKIQLCIGQVTCRLKKSLILRKVDYNCMILQI